MEATLQGQAPRAVGFTRATAHQFRLLWYTRRPLILAAGMAAIMFLAGEPWNPNPYARFLLVWPVWVAVVGPFWAFAVYHNEGPSSRLYHWSQPVPRHVHSLARLAAGAAWLLLLYVILALAGLLVASLDGDAWQFALIGAAGWANYFMAPLFGYLAISVITLLSDYPIRWFVGILFLVPMTLNFLDRWLDMDALFGWMEEPLVGSWGLGTSIAGPLNVSWNRIMAAVAERSGETVKYTTDFDISVWWLAAPLWLLALTAVIAAIATVHPDALPRLRRRS